MMTRVAPQYMAVCITLTMPVMWNMGTTPSTTASAEALLHRLPDTALCMMLEWMCTQPLGSPVVPLV